MGMVAGNDLDAQSWLEFVGRNERRTMELGITEDDVDRLISEYRAENRAPTLSAAGNRY